VEVDDKCTVDKLKKLIKKEKSVAYSAFDADQIKILDLSGAEIEISKELQELEDGIGLTKANPFKIEVPSSITGYYYILVYFVSKLY